MSYGRSIMALVGLSVALTACDSYDSAGPGGGDLDILPVRVIQANGDLAVALTDFRTTVGDPAHGGGTGPQPAGRREVRWDGVPVDQTNTDAFPADFFKGAGLISTTDGIGTRVSDNDFADINPSYAGEFESFSKAKTFMASGSARLTLRFRVPGTDTEGVVSGFGIVFSDVDRTARRTSPCTPSTAPISGTTPHPCGATRPATRS